MTRLETYTETWASEPRLDAVLRTVAQCRDPAILDSADTAETRGRFTILACDPLEVISCDPGDPDPFERLRGRLRELCNTAAREKPAPDEQLPFLGGWIGYFAYEAGHYVECIPGRPTRDIPLSLARWALYDSAAIHDSHSNQWFIVTTDLRGRHADALAPGDRLAFWRQLLARAHAISLPSPRPAPELVDNMSYAGYLDRVRRAKEYIAAGDIFQVNLARRFTLRQTEPAVSTYLRLRERNPAAYAAFLSWDEGRSAILSASPELFLDLRDANVITRPIKGTRPRSSNAIIDMSLSQELLASPKDVAELAMIVDLERNDLGRVCEFGSVRVHLPLPPSPSRRLAVARGGRGESDAHLPPLTRGGWGGSEHPVASPHPFAHLESHPTVHHLVATVRGRLRADRDCIDLLRATFPGGSITGAPKVRAMQIIDELEPTQRSVYTGAIGYIGLDGSMTLNIAIRTLIAASGQIHAYVGSGIVADSDPEEEYAETIAKAAGLCRALGLTDDPFVASR